MKKETKGKLRSFRLSRRVNAALRRAERNTGINQTTLIELCVVEQLCKAAKAIFLPKSGLGESAKPISG